MSLSAMESGAAASAGEPGVSAPAGAPDGRRWPRFGIGVLAGVLVFGLIVGLAAGLLGPRLRTPGDDSAEAGFLRDMSTHHRQAIHMAMVEYDRGQDPWLKRMGYDIATSQQYQVGVMEGWLN